MVELEHLSTASATCQNIQLHAIVEGNVMLLETVIGLSKQRGRYALVLSSELAREAQGGLSFP